MGDKSAIEWTDATWNPVTGCTKVSPGCKFCYAERITERRGQDFSKIILHSERLDQPLRWRKPRRIFVNSMSDLFHEEIPDEFIEQVFDVMLQTEHIFQVLTKRPERMQKWVTNFLHPGLFPRLFPQILENIWLGVSVENQEQADKRIPVLLQTPAAVRFLSVEPLLGPVDLREYFKKSPRCPTDSCIALDECSCLTRVGIDWVIVGGESVGPQVRRLVYEKCNDCGADRIHCRCGSGRIQWLPKSEALEWVRSIRDQCVTAGVLFFFKQWGGPTPKSGGRILDGQTWDEYPKEEA